MATTDERTDFEKYIDGTVQLARAVSEYFKTLVQDYGFNRDEALQLTLQFQANLFEMMRNKQDDNHA